MLFNLVAVSADSHQEVVWLDVTMNKVLVVYILNPTNHLQVCVCVCVEDIEVNIVNHDRTRERERIEQSDVWSSMKKPLAWSANIKTVFIVKRREQKLKRSSRLGPSRSITKTL